MTQGFADRNTGHRIVGGVLVEIWICGVNGHANNEKTERTGLGSGSRSAGGSGVGVGYVLASEPTSGDVDQKSGIH